MATAPSGPAAGNRFDGAAGNQFGGAPAPAFGAPAPVFGAPAGPVYAGPSLERKPRSRPGFSGLPGRGIIGVIVVLVVLGFFGFGRMAGLFLIFQGDLTAPRSLAGVPLMTDSGHLDLASSIGRELESENSGKGAVAAFYGQPDMVYTLVAQRGKADLAREFADIGAVGQGTAVGESTCAAAQNLTVCARTSRSLTVIVAGPLPAEQVAAAVDEAWDKV